MTDDLCVPAWQAKGEIAFMPPAPDGRAPGEHSRGGREGAFVAYYMLYSTLNQPRYCSSLAAWLWQRYFEKARTMIGSEKPAYPRRKAVGCTLGLGGFSDAANAGIFLISSSPENAGTILFPYLQPR